MTDRTTDEPRRPMLYLMNSPVLTNHGTFRFTPIPDVEAVKELVQNGFESAIGHQGAADVMTADLGVPVSVIRRSVFLEKGDQAICLRLVERLPEGQVLTADKLRKIPHEYGLITRIE